MRASAAANQEVAKKETEAAAKSGQPLQSKGSLKKWSNLVLGTPQRTSDGLQKQPSGVPGATAAGAVSPTSTGNNFPPASQKATHTPTLQGQGSGRLPNTPPHGILKQSSGVPGNKMPTGKQSPSRLLQTLIMALYENSECRMRLYSMCILCYKAEL